MSCTHQRMLHPLQSFIKVDRRTGTIRWESPDVCIQADGSLKLCAEDVSLPPLGASTLAVCCDEAVVSKEGEVVWHLSEEDCQHWTHVDCVRRLMQDNVFGLDCPRCAVELCNAGVGFQVTFCN